AVRNVGRAIRQRLAQPSAREPAAARGSLPYPWWCYPTAAAAASILAFLVWWGNTSGGVGGTPGTHPGPSYVIGPEPRVPFDMAGTGEAADEVALFNDVDTGSDDADAPAKPE